MDRSDRAIVIDFDARTVTTIDNTRKTITTTKLGAQEALPRRSAVLALLSAQATTAAVGSAGQRVTSPVRRSRL